MSEPEETKLLTQKEDKIYQTDPRLIQPTQQDILEIFGGSKAGQYSKFVLAALSSLPWVGVVASVAAGLTGAAFDLNGEKQQDKLNKLIGLWLHEHQGKFTELGHTIDEILTRLDSMGEEIKQRIESPEYLALVRKGFRSWDQADTMEKRQMIKKLLMNAGGTKLCPDDLVRLFIGWIDQYHEAHFVVIAQIQQNPNITRGQIWDNIHSTRPDENSSEADLFRYLIRDLSMGGVIRQSRDLNGNNEFLKKSTRGLHRSPTSSTMESAFEDDKPYELTKLGTEFVHYVMNDLVARIES